MIKNLWTRISNTGITDELPLIERSRVRVTNRIVITVAAISILYGLTDYFFWPDIQTADQLAWYYIVNIGFSVLFIPVLILNDKKLYQAARYLILSFAFLAFLMNGLVSTTPYKTELYFFVMAAFAFVMLNNKKAVILFFSIQAIGYFIIAQNILNQNPGLSGSTFGLAFRVAIAFSFLFFIFFFMQRETNRYQAQIEIKNSQLLNDRDEMEKINYTKDKIFSIISHDLRSPIASLQSLLALVNNEHIGADDFKKATNGLEKQVSQLSNTLDELLTWAKAQLHGINPDPQKIKIRSLVSQITTVSKVAARNKKIIITTSIPSDLEAYCDPNMFQSVITNLISNAIKFTPVGGAISISAERENNNVSIQVEDTGVGIPIENIDKILNPTIHFTTRGTNNEKGTGLGLAMCVEFIRKNNGTFNIHSEDGKGSKFEITLPLENQTS